jgi:cardiolipin synthase A/B
VTSASYIPFATSGSYPARTGNKVRPLVRGTDTFRRIGEAVDAAHHSIWLTIAFFAEDFRFPDERGALFEALDRAVARGVDVRMLVWRPNAEANPHPTMFKGTPAEREALGKRGTRVKIRWDRATARFCQHQKSWVIDAGHSSETAFVGGANVTARSFLHHDLYLEVTGPSATDVHHNFVQRWNEASERTAVDGNWACDASDVLPFPVRASEQQGTSTVQVQRMVMAGHYADGQAAPGASPFEIAQGEHSILEQYVLAIDAARRTIYLENQAIPTMAVAVPLARALDRGVEVVLLVPSIPEAYVYAARLDPAENPRFDGIETLSRYPSFLMAGLGPTYVHCKSMIIDDAWATIGSCNLHAFSLTGNVEMNASIWDGAIVRELRRTLLERHLAIDTGALDDRAALQLYRQVAQENRLKVERGETLEAGRPVALSPQRYGVR